MSIVLNSFLSSEKKFFFTRENRSSARPTELSLRPAHWTHGTQKREMAFRDVFCTFLELWVKVEQLAWLQHGRADNDNYRLCRETLIAGSLMDIRRIIFHLRHSLWPAGHVSNFNCIDNCIDNIKFFLLVIYKAEIQVCDDGRGCDIFPLPSLLIF